MNNVDDPNATTVATLRLLELFVLECVSPLAASDQGEQDQLAKRLFAGVDWRQQLMADLQLPDDFAASVREMFAVHEHSADDGGIDLEPADFARAFVMRNFVTGS